MMRRLDKLRVAMGAAQEKGAEDALALDVREVSSFADTFLILTGRSDRHVRAIAEAVVVALASRGEAPLGVEGETEGRWALLDFGDLIVHVFQRDVRQNYALERLWSDASVIRVAGKAAKPPRSAAQPSEARAPARMAAAVPEPPAAKPGGARKAAP
jgi:ribosome-associated protein